MSIFDKLTERVGDFFDEVMLPEDVRRAHDRAQREIGRGDYRQALEAMRPTLIKWPNIARTHHLIGMCHFHLGDYEEAIAAFDRALAIREQPHSHFYAGLAAEQLGRWRDAHRYFHAAMGLGENVPFEFDLHFGLGRVYGELGRPDKAIKELRAALKLWPGQHEAVVALARALVDRGEFDEARKVLDEQAEATSRADALVLFGRIQEAAGELEDARKAFEKALTKQSEVRQDALLGAARVNLALGRYVEANRHLIEALDQAEGQARAEIFALLGEINEGIENHAQARESYRAAIDLSPRLANALLGLGRLALRAENFEEAAAYFRRVHELGLPAHEQEALWGIGMTRLHGGDLAGARHLLEEALDLGGSRQVDVLHALGRVALAAGDPAEAVVLLQQARDRLTESGEARPRIEQDFHEALARLAPHWQLPDALDEPAQIVEVLEALSSYLGTHARLSEFLPATQRLLTAMNSPLSLAIVGEFNAGKSTLVNALIGEDVLPTGVLPTTAHTGIIKFGPRKAARVIYRDERVVETSFAEAKKIMKSEAGDIDRLEFTYPHPTLRTVHYWDTPGFNALEERHEEVAARALETAEAILWVLDANQVLSQTEFERIEKLPDADVRLVVVINKIDRFGPPGEREEAIEELLAYVQEHVGDRMAGCFAISALQARSEDAAQAEASGFAPFAQFLDTHIIQKAGRIKTVEISRQLDNLVATLEAFQNGLVNRYRALQSTAAEIEVWLEEEADQAPRARAREELTTLYEWMDFSLQAIENEIAEALKPASVWSSRMTIGDDDRAFILELLAERFDTVLDRSRQRILAEVGAMETALAERMDPVVRGLSLQDARAMNRRIEGFFDETRVLKLLFEERIFGRLRARAQGRIEAAGEKTLRTIEAAQSDRSRWRPALRGLLPEIREELRDELEAWHRQFLETAVRFCRRVVGDLELLELEARHRYDVSPLVALGLGQLAPDEDEGAPDEDRRAPEDE